MTSSPISLCARRILLIGLALLALILSAQVMNPTKAEARCIGVNKPVTSTLGASAAFVTEKPNAGTCNNNNYYAGTIQALNRADVLFIAVYIQNGGTWTRKQYTNVKTRPVEYSFSDNNSNSFMTLCWFSDDSGPLGTPHCGWGSQVVNGYTPESRPDLFNQAQYHGVVSGF